MRTMIDALMVVLKISNWSARKYDREATKVVDGYYNAHSSGRFNKRLLEGKALNKVMSAAGAIRGFHYSMTLPWLDNGTRLLPTGLYFKYYDKMSQLKLEYEQAVQDLVKNYEELVEDARGTLGDLFKESDYPNVYAIKNKFGMQLSFLPMPESGDFRVGIESSDLEDLKRDFEIQSDQRLTEATKETWKRLASVLATMKDKLADTEAKFHSSLVNNVNDLCDKAYEFNLTKDPELYGIIDEIKFALVSPKELRENPGSRKQCVIKAEEILDKIHGKI